MSRLPCGKNLARDFTATLDQTKRYPTPLRRMDNASELAHYHSVIIEQIGSNRQL
ncbi:MAG: hypothetical protein VX704_00210 [Verrucomicrobiota bacterium]|nr:hypothetical protein [Verrucomicrobiota bacterium]